LVIVFVVGRHGDGSKRKAPRAKSGVCAASIDMASGKKIESDFVDEARYHDLFCTRSGKLALPAWVVRVVVRYRYICILNIYRREHLFARPSGK
jgi:hypothetical protein